MKNYIKYFALLCAIFLFSGCIKSPQESKIEFEQTSVDKYLAKKFSKYIVDDRYYTQTSTEQIELRRRVVDYGDGVNNFQTVAHARKYFIGNEVFKDYKDAIVQRGNTYKTYTADFNNRIWSIYLGGQLITYNDITSRKYYWNLLPVIAEYDKDNNLRSIMLNRVEVGVTFNDFAQPRAPATIFLINRLIYGNELILIENSISKKLWEANLVYSSED